MVAASISVQPGQAGVIKIRAAYRRLFYVVVSDSAADQLLPMYADIYIGWSPVYYKSMECYSIDGVGGVLTGHGIYQFDVQDALQEWFNTVKPTLPVSTVQAASDEIQVIVAFRGSAITSGILIPEAPIPIEGTLTTPPVDGGGMNSEPFICYNSSILPYADLDIFRNSLESIIGVKQLMPSLLLSGTRIYPMSNFPLGVGGNAPAVPDPNNALTVYKSDRGGFPFTIVEYGISGVTPRGSRSCSLNLEYANPTASIGSVNLLTAFTLVSGSYLIPYGFKEVYDLLVAAGQTTLANDLFNPNNDLYFRLILTDATASNPAFYTPWQRARQSAIEQKRLCFQNTYGMFEWVSFVRNSTKFDVKSSEQFVPLYSNLLSGPQPVALGHNRNSIVAVDEYTYTAVFPESHMQWLRELMMSPLAFEQTTTDDGSVYLNPVKVKDGSFMVRKTVMDNRLQYEVSIVLQPSIDYITLRN